MHPYGGSAQVAATNPVQVTDPLTTPAALSAPGSNLTGAFPVIWSVSDGAT
jgi:hypothetical protein